MRRTMERLVLLPFSVGCISESSVAVGIQHSGRSKPVDSNSSPRSRDEKDHQVGEEDEAAETLMEESMKNSQRFSALAKPNIAVGFHRIYKGFKNISQLFVYKEDMEEMEIGSPTDVKHVTHIGCDASSRSSDANPLIANWETLLSSTNSWRKFDEVLSNPQNFPNIVHHSI